MYWGVGGSLASVSELGKGFTKHSVPVGRPKGPALELRVSGMAFRRSTT